jgi:hypothetical protein
LLASRLAGALALVACSAPPKPAPVPASAAPKRDLAVAEPTRPPPAQPDEPPDPYAWVIDANRPRPARDIVITRRVNQAPVEIDVAERDLWMPCVRDFVAVQSPPARRVLTAAFARYPTSCDAEKRIVIDAPREYRDRFVVFRGPLAAMTFDLVTCGSAPAGAVAITYDGKRWTGIATSTQVGACTTTSVPDMPSLRRVLRDLVDARDVTVHDVVVTDEMKRDLRLVLDALDALDALSAR